MFFAGRMKSDKIKLIKAIKTINVTLNDSDEICRQVENKICVKNAVTLLSFNRSNFSKFFMIPLRVIECCFPTIADSSSFLELDPILVKKILLSSELHVDSELQVITAADAWMNHNLLEREKHAEDLVKKFRLHLLTDVALTEISGKVSWLGEALEENPMQERQLVLNNFRATTRHCSHNYFNIIVSGGEDYITRKVAKNVHIVDANSLYIVKKLPKMRERRSYSQMFCIKGEVYAFGGDDGSSKSTTVENYSRSTNAWKVVADINDFRSGFCACSFVDSIYVFGGYLRGNVHTCVKLNTATCTWKKIAELHEAKRYASCAVFEGRIVVTGGLSHQVLRSVHAYDYVDDSWSVMPNMIKGRCHHKSVAVKNKLYVIGGCLTPNCEVFDSTSNTFVLLKEPNDSLARMLMKLGEISFEAFSNGGELIVFTNDKHVLVYDIESDKWRGKSCQATNRIEYFSCAKVSKFF